MRGRSPLDGGDDLLDLIERVRCRPNLQLGSSAATPSTMKANRYNRMLLMEHPSSPHDARDEVRDADQGANTKEHKYLQALYAPLPLHERSRRGGLSSCRASQTSTAWVDQSSPI